MPKFYCTHCGQHIDAPLELAGQSAGCPACSNQVIVPIAHASAKFYCTHCGQHIDAPLELAGQSASCPACSNQVIVPIAHASAPSPLAGSDLAANPQTRRRDPQMQVGLGQLGFLGAFVGSVFLGAFAATLTGVSFAGFLVALPFIIWAACSRMKNAGKHEAWAILAIVPIVSLVFYCYCLVAPPGHSNKTN